jgi:two-component system chemotaxis sensor kinase CheA
MFYEEARENLISLEEGLMDLERRQGDRAHLDKTFRAAHSLKGAAAMVGLGAIAEFTHGIEAVLERIRAGTVVVDSNMITTLLEARDHLAAMVEGEAARSSVPGSAELTFRLAVLLRGGGAEARSAAAPPAGAATPGSVSIPPRAPGPALTPVASGAPGDLLPGQGAPQPESATQTESTTPHGASTPTEPARAKRGKAAQANGPKPAVRPRAARKTPRKMAQSAKPSDMTGASAGATRPAGRGTNKEYRITLSPGPDILRRGINPLGVFDELREYGPTTLKTDPDVVPVLEELDPERCYLTWTITVSTSVEAARIHEVFLFFNEDSTLSIEERTGSGPWSLVRPEPSIPVASMDSGGNGAQVALPERVTPPVAPAEPPSAAVPGRPMALPVATGLGAATKAVHSPAGGAQQPPRPVPRSSARIRVDALQLDDLVGLAGELAVLSDNLMGLREGGVIKNLLRDLESLQRVSREIRDRTLDLRMVPVDELFSRAPRVVRDLADRSGKEVELRVLGQETRLDRTIVERLNDPLVHLIRNAVDHALEAPSERTEKGKPRLGRITLSAGHEGDRVAIRVEDDGRGLDREKIVRKGIALGMIAAGTAPEDPRVVSLIFEPGFSTRESVSEVSGRGVGLDVVRDAVRALRGTVAVESTPGKGTAFIFRLPLTLALIDGLLVEAAGGRYVVPLAQVEECVALNGTRSALAEGRPCVAVRGELVPMVALRTLFRTDGAAPPRQELLLTRHAGQRVGVAVDRLLGRVQAVIQSLGEGLHGVSRFSGATILGDGSVSLILDLSALVSESRSAEQGNRFNPSAGLRAEITR